MPFKPLTIQPVAPPPMAPTWQECTYIFRRACGSIFTTDAWRYGTFFVHVTLPEEERVLFVLTHGPSRIAVVRVEAVEDATEIAEFLWTNYREAFCHPGEEVDKAKIPADVIQWIKKCNTERRYVR